VKVTPVQPLLDGQVEVLDERGVRWRTLPHISCFRISERGESEILDKRQGEGGRGNHQGVWRRQRTRVDEDTGHLIKESKISSKYIYRLMGQAFFGELGWRQRIAFVNGDVGDLRIENLTVAGSGKRAPGTEPFKTRKSGSGQRRRRKRGGTPVVLTASARRFPDDMAQKLIDDWFRGDYDTYAEAAESLGIPVLSANRIILGKCRKHLTRPEDRLRYTSSTPISTLREVINRWNAGDFATKRQVARYYNLEDAFVTRLLNGDASKKLYAVVPSPVVKRNLGGKKAGRLTAKDVLAIRQRVARGEKKTEIAADFGISSTHVGDVARGKKCWKHVGGPLEPKAP